MLEYSNITLSISIFGFNWYIVDHMSYEKKKYWELQFSPALIVFVDNVLYNQNIALCSIFKKKKLWPVVIGAKGIFCTKT